MSTAKSSDSDDNLLEPLLQQRDDDDGNDNDNGTVVIKENWTSQYTNGKNNKSEDPAPSGKYNKNASGHYKKAALGSSTNNLFNRRKRAILIIVVTFLFLFYMNSMLMNRNSDERIPVTHHSHVPGMKALTNFARIATAVQRQSTTMAVTMKREKIPRTTRSTDGGRLVPLRRSTAMPSLATTTTLRTPTVVNTTTIAFTQITTSSNLSTTISTNSTILPPPSGYLVWSDKCKMPSIDPYTPEVMQFFKREKYEPCSTSKPLTRVVFNSTAKRYALLINEDQVKYYTKSGGLLDCCYQVIERKSSGKKADQEVGLSECLSFRSPVLLPNTAYNILVKCKSKKKQIYSNGHPMMPERPGIRKRLNEWKEKGTEKPVSVLMVGIDSISRVNLIRAMPKTAQYLYDNEWFEMSGYNKKYVTTPQMAENVLGRLKQRFGNHVSGRKSSSDAAMRSLELLRITIQTAFDKDVDTIVKKFIEVYFKPAIKNIKENLGDHIVTEDMLQKMMCALLENSKSQYNLHRTKPALVTTPSAAPATLTTNSEQISIKPETSTQTNFAIKRPAPRTFTTDISTQASKKLNLTVSQQQEIPPLPTATPPPHPQPQQSTRPTVIPPRRQIFWNTASISTETNFVLDVQANQAFGFGTDGKERLASKHPELIRYLPDGQDRDWLVDRKIIPSQNRNSRFLFLIYDEVKKLGQTDLYKDRDNLNLSILHIFKIPNFIIQKMKLFFIDLNIKSRGLITNSYSAMANSSHLRNALLQGSSQATTSSIPTTSTTAASSSVNSVSTSTDAVSSPPKVKSSLSSSHATLTALLTNNSGTNGSSKLVAPNDKRASDSSQSCSAQEGGSTKAENSAKEV